MKEKIIAMRTRWVLAVHIFAIATMAAFLSAAAYLSFRPGGWLSESKVFWAVDAVIFVLGMTLLMVSGREIVRYCRVPRIIAVCRGSEIEFLGEKFSLSEIAEVSGRMPRGRHGAALTWWGKLTVILKDGRTLSCDYVGDIGFVRARLLALRYEYAANDAVTGSKGENNG